MSSKVYSHPEPLCVVVHGPDGGGGGIAQIEPRPLVVVDVQTRLRGGVACGGVHGNGGSQGNGKVLVLRHCGPVGHAVA
jgi:hypothetical protein